jgi:hypothetical protein
MSLLSTAYPQPILTLSRFGANHPLAILPPKHQQICPTITSVYLPLAPLPEAEQRIMVYEEEMPAASLAMA